MMNDPFEVIAAFVDGERVNPDALKSALERPDGRDYLVEIVALREVTGHDARSSAYAAKPRSGWLVAGAAAAVVVSLTGGYLLGHRAAPPPPPAVTIAADAVPAPAPTRVIEVPPGDSHVTKGGL